MEIAILAVGNEVLCGKTINTNSAYLAQEVEKLGGTVVYQQVVADLEEEIVKGLRQAYSYANIVVTIGGLGPTVDDLTRQGVAAYFDEPLVYDEVIYEGIRGHFERMKRPMPPSNERQAYGFEAGCFIHNPNGTAPGLFLEKNNQAIFLLPGPPSELKPMVLANVIPYLTERVGERQISRSYRLFGIGESFAEEKILHLYEQYPMLNIAPYCSLSFVDYVILAPEKYETQVCAFEEDFLNCLGEYCIGDQTTLMNSEVVKLLKEKKLTIATAESCTGGLLASELVNVEGASSVFLEGLVTYSYESKIKRLAVDSEDLIQYGAVSEQVARQMSENLRAQSGCDVAVSVTGVAGPGGGSALKPVGLVYIAISVADETFVYSKIFSGNREKIRKRSVGQALYAVYCYLKTL